MILSGSGLAAIKNMIGLLMARRGDSAGMLNEIIEESWPSGAPAKRRAGSTAGRAGTKTFRGKTR